MATGTTSWSRGAPNKVGQFIVFQRLNSIGRRNGISMRLMACIPLLSSQPVAQENRVSVGFPRAGWGSLKRGRRRAHRRSASAWARRWRSRGSRGRRGWIGPGCCAGRKALDVFACPRSLDVFACPRCGGRRKVLAYVTAPAGVRSILEHQGLPTQALKRAPARGPPQRAWC
jgi:hypothetical protein